MSAATHRSQRRSMIDAALPGEKPRTRGFLRIVRHGSGGGTIYVVTYHSLDRDPHADALGQLTSPMLAEGATTLIDLLERLGVDFRLSEVREALEDILRLGSANIPDLWFTAEQLVQSRMTDT
jgi:hypothetical protein